jgi:hypothetical protein
MLYTIVSPIVEVAYLTAIVFFRSYMFLSWFVAQVFSADGTEGRNLLAVLVPPVLRRYLFREREEVQEGDVRGVEREASFHEGSVRAYKVSKTYSGKVLLAAGTFLFF